MSDLMEKTCKPRDGAVKGEELRKLFGQLQFGWTMPNEHHLEKEYRFKDFREALDFVNRLGEVAERGGPPPGRLPRLGEGEGDAVDPLGGRA